MLQEVDCLDISLIRDTRMGRYAKIPKVNRINIHLKKAMKREDKSVITTVDSTIISRCISLPSIDQKQQHNFIPPFPILPSLWQSNSRIIAQLILLGSDWILRHSVHTSNVTGGSCHVASNFYLLDCCISTRQAAAREGGRDALHRRRGWRGRAQVAKWRVTVCRFGSQLVGTSCIDPYRTMHTKRYCITV